MCVCDFCFCFLFFCFLLLVFFVVWCCFARVIELALHSSDEGKALLSARSMFHEDVDEVWMIFSFISFSFLFLFIYFILFILFYLAFPTAKLTTICAPGFHRGRREETEPE